MSQLLQYLVEQSIADPANPPKAYHVAVEGLGKSEDFDVQADSYPRVQAGRLRKMLKAYYANNRLEQRFTIPMGSYGIAIDASLLKSNKDKEESVALTVPEPKEPEAENQPVPSFHENKPAWIKNPITQRTMAGFAMILATIFVVPIMKSYFSNTSENSKVASSNEFSRSPTLFIGRVKLDGTGVSERMARQIRTHLVSSFQPFPTVRVSSKYSNKDSQSDSEDAYRIDAKLIDNGDQSTLSMQLVSLNRQQLVWSREIDFPNSQKAMESALNPAVSKIASFYGIIPNDQRAHMRSGQNLGHSCILKFDEYRLLREQKMLESVEDCIETSLKIEPLNPNLLSAAAFLEFVDPDLSKRKHSKKRGEKLAVKALVRGKNNSIANFGIARAAFFAGNCKRGIEYAKRAVDLNPLGHDILVNTGSYMFACGNPEAEQYLQRAIDLDPDGSIAQYTAMVFLKMEQGKNKEALKVAESIVPPAGRTEPYYDLAMAMVYAEDGQLMESAKAWERLEKTYGKSGSETPEQILGAFITSKPLINRGLDLLKKKKVVQLYRSENYPLAG